MLQTTLFLALAPMQIASEGPWQLPIASLLRTTTFMQHAAHVTHWVGTGCKIYSIYRDVSSAIQLF